MSCREQIVCTGCSLAAVAFWVWDTGRATVLTDKAGRASRDQLKKTLNARLSNIVSVL